MKAGLDIVVAVGLLQLAPKKVTPRVTGALGFATSLISCYQVFDFMLLVLDWTFFLFVSFLLTRQLDVISEWIRKSLIM